MLQSADVFYYESPIGLLQIKIVNNKIQQLSKISKKPKKSVNKVYKFSFIKNKNNKKFTNSMLIPNIKLSLDSYFSNAGSLASLPVDLKGTVFQKRVWNYLRKIPLGSSQTYSDVAKGIKNNKAVRAVGSACGKNPVLLLVPCHRVVAKEGLGGFAVGLRVKTYLLEHENGT